ncbi:MAG: hypothetical protein AAFV85_12990 [Cyanobacteria bacterium J06634_6]
MKYTAASALIITVLFLAIFFSSPAQAAASTEVTETEALGPVILRRDPYSIVMAAKQKPSPLKGTVPDARKPTLPTITNKIPVTLSQLKDQIDTTLRAQPERLRLAIGAQRLQQQWQTAQDSLKAKLRNLVKRVETTAHQAAEDLR